MFFFFFSSRRRHTRSTRDWSSDVCSSDLKVAQAYKQIDAAVGQFGLATLQASTRAIESNSAGDSTYSNIENQLISLTNERNAVAAQMITALEGAEFGGQSISEQQAQSLVSQGRALIAEANALGS